MTKLKTLFSICFVLLAFMLAMSSCNGFNAVDESDKGRLDLEKESQIKTITVTIEGDAHITVKDPKSFQMESSTAWAQVKSKAHAMVEVESGYRIKNNWKLKSNGEILKDSDVFTGDVTVLAESEELPKDASKQVKITVKSGGEHVEVLDAKPIIGIKRGAPNATTWGAIRDEAKGKLKFKEGYELHSWRLGSATGDTLLDNHTFDNDSEVYAIAKQSPKAPGGGIGEGGGSNPPGGGSNPPGGGTTPNPPSPPTKQQYSLYFFIIKGVSLSDSEFTGFSIKAVNVKTNKEVHPHDAVSEGDELEFTVTLQPDTNVEEWRLNNAVVGYGTNTYRMVVSGIISVTARVERSQFTHYNSTISGRRVNETKPPRTTANGMLVFPSMIGNDKIKTISIDVTNTWCKHLCRHQNVKYVYVADGIEDMYADDVFSDDVGGFRSEMRSISLPNTLKRIGTSTLSGLPHLVRYLIIPRSVQSIENTLSKYWTGNVGLSVYFEHETEAEVNALVLNNNWCAGSYITGSNISAENTEGRGIHIMVKNEKMKEKLNALDCKGKYKIVSSSAMTIPIPGDEPDGGIW